MLKKEKNSSVFLKNGRDLVVKKKISSFYLGITLGGGGQIKALMGGIHICFTKTLYLAKWSKGEVWL